MQQNAVPTLSVVVDKLQTFFDQRDIARHAAAGGTLAHGGRCRMDRALGNGDPRTCLRAAALMVGEEARSLPNLLCCRGVHPGACPTWLLDAGRLGRLWELAWFRSCFWSGLGTHLAKERPEKIELPLQGRRDEMRSQSFYKFRIKGATPPCTPSNGKLLGFDEHWFDSTLTEPTGFTHGLNFSQLLPILSNDARLAKSSRTKGHLVGAWVTEENDFKSCEPYAGPEKPFGAEGDWAQAFLIGTTWDLMKAGKPRSYRCIRAMEGHVCTHVLIRVWPNDERGDLSLNTYHYRPPFGMEESATEVFKRQMFNWLRGKSVSFSCWVRAATAPPVTASTPPRKAKRRRSRGQISQEYVQDKKFRNGLRNILNTPGRHVVCSSCWSWIPTGDFGAHTYDQGSSIITCCDQMTAGDAVSFALQQLMNPEAAWKTWCMGHSNEENDWLWSRMPSSERPHAGSHFAISITDARVVRLHSA